MASVATLLLLLVITKISHPFTTHNIRELSVFPMNIYYGSSATEAGEVSIITSSDGGILLAGTSEQNGTKDLLLIKTNAEGVVQWSRLIEGS